MTTSHTATGHQLRKRSRTEGFNDPCNLLDTIVGSFPGDHDIVYMALAQASAANADKARVLLQLADRAASNVSHAALYPANELVHDHPDSAAIGYATFDAFRHKLREPVAFRPIVRQNLHGGIAIGGLEISLAGTLRHRSERPHAPICLKRTALVQNRLTRTLFRPSKQRANHHAACTRRK